MHVYVLSYVYKCPEINKEMHVCGVKSFGLTRLANQCDFAKQCGVFFYIKKINFSILICRCSSNVPKETHYYYGL